VNFKNSLFFLKFLAMFQLLIRINSLANSNTCLLINNSKLFLNFKKASILSTNLCSNKYSTNDSENLASIKKKKYNKPPPIDLNAVRVNLADGDQDSSKKTSWPGAYALLTIPIATLLLGFWQIKRRENKLELIKFLEERTKSQPTDLPTDLDVLEKLVETDEYRPFKVKGYFLHSKEIVITPRSDLTGTLQGTGANIITPFVLSSNPKLIVLVNRGYVPYTHLSPMSRRAAQSEDEVEIIGLLRGKLEYTNTFTPVNKPPFEWHFRDVNRMAEVLGTVPIFLDARRDTESSSIRGGPIGGQTAINIRNEHMSYIITWFSLSILTSYLWWRRFGRLLF